MCVRVSSAVIVEGICVRNYRGMEVYMVGTEGKSMRGSEVTGRGK
jgi:hypothetical protein